LLFVKRGGARLKRVKLSRQEAKAPEFSFSCRQHDSDGWTFAVHAEK